MNFQRLLSILLVEKEDSTISSATIWQSPPQDIKYISKSEIPQDSLLGYSSNVS